MSTMTEERRSDGDEPRFIADAMLGRLVRWMRLLGYDVLYDPGLKDREIARIAVRERRVVLTRDRELLASRAIRLDRPGIMVDADRVRDQLAIVFGALGLQPRAGLLFSRCSKCNGSLADVTPQTVRGRVPPFVLKTSTRFSVCEGCGQVYWDGTHRELVRRQLAALVPSLDI